MPEPRERHTLTTIKNKSILFGGTGFVEDSKKRAIFNEVWLLFISPKKMNWNKPKIEKPDDAIPCPRYNHTCVSYNNIIYLFGGFDGVNYLNDVWSLTDKSTDQEDIFEWKRIHDNKEDKNSPSPRFQHSAAVYKDKMFVFGGKGNNHNVMKDLWTFDFKSHKWSLLNLDGTPPPARFGHIAQMIHDNMFVFGGFSPNETNKYPSDVYCLDLIEMCWELKIIPNGPSGRILSSSCIFDKENLFIFGGITFQNKTLQRSDEIWILNTGLNNAQKKQKLKNYITIKEIGSGTYAQVYLAKKIPDNTYHALKRIILEWKNDDEDGIIALPTIDVLKEVDLLKLANHRNVLSVEEYFLLKIQERVCIAIISPYCDLGTLYSYIIKNTGATELEILFIFVQIMDGISYLHHNKILHRDIKPHNILVKTEMLENEAMPLILIADFGFAKNVKTRTGTVLGTKKYMAPEIHSNSLYSESVDIWSIGCLFYFMLMKHEVDFKVKNSKQIIEEIIKKYKFGDRYVKWILECTNTNAESRITSENLYKEVKNTYKELYQTLSESRKKEDEKRREKEERKRLEEEKRIEEERRKSEEDSNPNSRHRLKPVFSKVPIPIIIENSPLTPLSDPEKRDSDEDLKRISESPVPMVMSSPEPEEKRDSSPMDINLIALEKKYLHPSCYLNL